MTYCVAITLDAGLVLTSDSRTNAGINQVSTYSKMTRFETHADRSLVLMSAGNLATTQFVIEQIHRDIRESQPHNLNTRHIPVIFMIGLTESEHVVADFFPPAELTGMIRRRKRCALWLSWIFTAAIKR